MQEHSYMEKDKRNDFLCIPFFTNVVPAYFRI